MSGNKFVGVTDFASPKTVVDWLNNGFEEYRTSAAICFEDQSISYDKLDKLTNKIAHYLANRGISRGDRIGLSLERSPEMVACVIGILKSGAAYVPLDPSYPINRLQIMTEDAQLSLLITNEKYSGRFSTNSDSIIEWENVVSKVENCADDPPSTEIDDEDIAYVIFTSGSTGRPKGIEMPHRALSNLIEWQLERNYFRQGARVLQYSSISFDVSFQEITTTLASGGTLFLIDDTERRDPRILLDRLTDDRIERLFIPFVALRSMIEVANTKDRLPDSLQEVITAGEQLRVDGGLRNFFSQLPDSTLDNQYGPSETHVISAYLLDGDPAGWPDLPPIGKPITHSHIYILDKDMNPVGEGEQGELYLAGRNIAHGYLGRDDLTKKVFIKNPFEDGDYPILYKTGDLGLYNKDGDIEFLGRVDHQIKIRGYRIEPGEINAVGTKFPGIAQCLTHTFYDQTGHSQLITYYLSQKGSNVNKADFKTYLKSQLPEYMVPAFVLELHKIPYTPSGKVDFKSLPKPGKSESVEDEPVVYESQTETRLAKIWSTIFGFDNIPRSSNFFDLGGDSLKAVTLFMEIEEQLDQYLPLSVLTQAPSIAELASVIDNKDQKQDVSKFRSLQVIQRGREGKAPLFLVHGGAGNILMFRDLAEGLPSDQPIYAFQWPGWDGGKGINEISAMAEFYKNELREAFPEGPYRLGGYCIGGIIVLEMAELLKNEGAEIIDPILIADSPNIHSKYFYPGNPAATSETRKIFEMLQQNMNSQLPVIQNGSELKKKKPNGAEKKYSDRRYPLLAKYVPFYLQLGQVYLKINRVLRSNIQDLRIRLRMLLSLKMPVKDRRRYCQIVQIKAVQNHKETVYEGDILYLKSKILHGEKVSIEGWWNDLFFGFGELCSGHFDAHIVGGGHNDVFNNERSSKIVTKKMLMINDE